MVLYLPTTAAEAEAAEARSKEIERIIQENRIKHERAMAAAPARPAVMLEPDMPARFRAIKQVLEATPMFPSELPEKAYHYTNTAGLKGVLEKRELWATDLAYLNDLSEYTYSEQLAKQAWAAAEPECPAAFRNLLRTCFEEDRRDSGPPLHACCFCARPDLLSQWRNYTGGGTGYAIEFNLRRLHEADPRFFIGRIEYEEVAQKKVLAEIAKRLMNPSTFIANIPEWAWAAEQDSPTIVHLGLAREAVYLARAFLKSRIFSEEQEWRLALLGLDDAEFRIVSGALLPYVVIPLGPPETIPISRVIVGPSARPKPAFEATRRLLKKHGFGHILLQSTEFPVQA